MDADSALHKGMPDWPAEEGGEALEEEEGEGGVRAFGFPSRRIWENVRDSSSPSDPLGVVRWSWQAMLAPASIGSTRVSVLARARGPFSTSSTLSTCASAACTRRVCLVLIVERIFSRLVTGAVEAASQSYEGSIARDAETHLRRDR